MSTVHSAVNESLIVINSLVLSALSRNNADEMRALVKTLEYNRTKINDAYASLMGKLNAKAFGR